MLTFVAQLWFALLAAHDLRDWRVCEQWIVCGCTLSTWAGVKLCIRSCLCIRLAMFFLLQGILIGSIPGIPGSVDNRSIRVIRSVSALRFYTTKLRIYICCQVQSQLLFQIQV